MRRLRSVAAHLRRPASAESAPYPRLIDADPDPDPAVYGQLTDEPLDYTPRDGEAIVRALRTSGAALLRGVLGGAELEGMRRELLGYDESEGEEGNDGMVSVGSRNFVEMFNRHPRWLPLLTPPDPVPSALAELLGREYKCISQKALRHAPGHNDYRVVPDERTFDAEGRSATPPPGWDADGFHADQVWAPSGLTADVALEHGITIPLLIITAYQYINGTDRQRCPTRVTPGSWLSCSEDGRSEWAGEHSKVVLAEPGDLLLFRSDGEGGSSLCVFLPFLRFLREATAHSLAQRIGQPHSGSSTARRRDQFRGTQGGGRRLRRREYVPAPPSRRRDRGGDQRRTAARAGQEEGAPMTAFECPCLLYLILR